MRSIRSGSGLGDSIYLQSAVRHLAQREEIEVCSDWPEVFWPLSRCKKVVVKPFRRDVDIRAHYAMRKGVRATDQFQDVCIAAGIKGPVKFELGWTPINRELIERIRYGGKPVVIVQLPRRPFDRKDGFGTELLPDCNVIQAAIDLIKPAAKIVQIGKGDALHRFSGIDVDLANNTSVSDLLDVAAAADGFLGYVSFLVPLAESLNKPALMVWSRAGLDSRHEFIRQITPEKIFHRASSHAIIDDCAADQLAAAAAAFHRQIATGAMVQREIGGDRRLGSRVA